MFAIVVLCWCLRTEFAAATYSWHQEVNQPSEECGKLVAKWNETMKINPEEMGDYIEGDILFPTISKNGVVNSGERWDEGIVPYEIAGPYSSQDLDVIHQAISQYHTHTCIRFREKKPDDSDYLLIENTKTGCWSSVGKTGGQQKLNLQSPGCLSTIGTALHELQHAIGFTHEHNRYIRDEYIDILWDNIESGKKECFRRNDDVTWTSFGFGYDYESITHDSECAHSTNGKPTIVTKVAGVKIGQRAGLSEIDVAKIKRMYNCKHKSIA